ncbi:MAG TPA: SGNH/GDSL hydrolase family protein [Vicinamibacterales bacterium]|jgi:lysophospholipase L1-like esterase
MKRGILAGLVVWSLVLAGTASAQRQAADHWVGTWATAPVSVPSQPGGPAQLGAQGPPPAVNNQTLRQIVHTSIGGDRVRVVLTNAFGTGRLAIGGAHIALRDKGGAIVDGSDHVLTFGGAPTMSIPPGGLIVSDPTNLRVPAMGDLAIDVYLPGDTAASPSPLTMHTGARQTNYISSTGNHLGMKELPGATTTPSWFFLSRVEVAAPAQTAAIVTFGDSITDGYNSTPDTNNRWPDHLAKRLMSAGGGFGVLNLGIDGNRVLNEIAGPAALARFDRDVLAAPGVTHVFVLEGINDLGISSLLNDGLRPTPEQLIAGHRQLIARAHEKGLRIFASTLLPYENTAIPGYYNEEGEKVRQAFNEWMRTAKEYDGFVDFDQVMRDPSHPAKMLEKYDSGDHLHPNDAGYQAMANAFNLAFVKEGAAKSSGR